jgi:hypothetical protein
VQDARRAVARFVDETGPFCKLLAWLRRAARGDPAPLTPVPPLADGRGGSEWVFCGDAASSLVSDVVGLSTRAAVEALVRQMRVMRAKLIEEGLESHAVRTHPPRRTTSRLARRACSRAYSRGECPSFCRRLWNCRRLRQVRSDTINLIEATLVRLAFLLSADDAAHYRLIVRRGPAVRRLECESRRADVSELHLRALVHTLPNTRTKPHARAHQPTWTARP